MFDLSPHPIVLAAALVIDRLFGDPAWVWARLPHPVVLMGELISILDRRLNDPALSFAARRRRGILAAAGLVGAGIVAGAAVHLLLSSIPLGLAAEALIVSVLLAQKSLVQHVSDVAAALQENGLAGGRQAVALIVGRDVAVLDEAGVSRAAIESAAENFSDGVVAPALFYALLGLPGLFVYKLANTADSMVGHRSPRYLAFGWAAARLDDLLNLAPARLSALLITAAALLTRRDAGGALRAATTDARRHRSPNAGWPEATAAGALGLALGGPRIYGDIVVDGAWLNAAGRRDVGPDEIRAAVRLIEAAWAVFASSVTLFALSTAL